MNEGLENNRFRYHTLLLGSVLACLSFLAVGIYIVWDNLRTNDPFASPEVHFLIPPNFKGAIVLSPIENGGSQPRQLNSDYSVVNVPASGKIYFPQHDLLYGWKRISAKYTNGSLLPYGAELKQDDNATIALWSLYTDGDGNVWMYVGDRIEVTQAHMEFSLLPGKPVEKDVSKEKMSPKVPARFE